MATTLADVELAQRTLFCLQQVADLGIMPIWRPELLVAAS